MNRNELLKKIGAYFERTYSEPGLGRYKPDEVGYWKIITGTDKTGFNREELPEILHGKFSDAVAQAVQQAGFYSHFSKRGSEDGFVTKIHIQELPDYHIPRVLARDFGPIVESD